jgi:hypothetical protein
MIDRGMGVAHRRGGHLRVEPAAHEQHLEALAKIAAGEALFGFEVQGTFKQWWRDAGIPWHRRVDTRQRSQLSRKRRDFPTGSA